MSEYKWQRKASDDDEGGDKATEVNRARALAVVGRKVVSAAM